MKRRLSLDEIGWLFQRIGQAIWHSQHVEETLATHIAIRHEIKTPGSVDREEADRIFAKYSKMSLGQLSKFAFKHHVLTSEIEDELNRFVDERNWIVHRLVRENSSDLYVDGKREHIFLRLSNFYEQCRAFHESIAEDALAYGRSVGVSEAWVNARATEDLARMRGGRQADS